MRFLVTGVNGQLGHDVMNELAVRGHEGIGTDITSEYNGIAGESSVSGMPYVSLDITDKKAVDRIIREVSPDAVIHCAAWTAVDMAEEEDKAETVRKTPSGSACRLFLTVIKKGIC